MLWFVRNDTKPKDTLKYFRNCFAHGNFNKKQKNKLTCITIENIYKGKLKAKGFIPIVKLKSLISATISCKV